MEVPRIWWMCVHEVEDTMFKNEIEDSLNYVGR